MDDSFLLQLLAGVQRKEVHWNPTINEIDCSNCGSCFNFCKHDVYAQNNNIFKVANSTNCVLLCNRYAGICPNGAISFPTKKDLLKEIISIRKNK